MSSWITQLEGSESLPPTSSHPTTPQRGDEGESDRPSLWVDRSMSETFEEYPIMGWEPIDDDLRGEIHKVSESKDQFLNEAFTKTLPNVARLQTKKVYGLPKNEESRCPKLDLLVKTRMSKNNKVQDTKLSKIQAIRLDAIGPLAFHLEEASKEGTTSIPMQVVTEATRTVLRLLGSAISHISTLRRKILQDLNPDLQDLVEREDVFKSSAPLLFGEGFEVKAKAYTEGLRVLSTASSSKRKVDFREHRPSYGQRRGGGRRNDRYQPYWYQAHKGGRLQQQKKRNLHEEVRQIEDHYINNINSRHIIHNKVIFSTECQLTNHIVAKGIVPLPAGE